MKHAFYRHSAAAFAALFIAVLLFGLSTPVQAQGLSSARSVALGSGATALAAGADAAKFNPANIGLKQFQRTGIELAGLGADISNNSFTLGDYNKYTGAFLTDSDKDDILSKVADEGLKLNADAEASAVAISLSSFVVGVSGHGLADVNLSKDVLELILNGNTFADTIEITGSYSEALAYGAAYLSYGRCIYDAGTRQLSVGATIKYLHGFGYERVVKLEGMAATFATGFSGDGEIVLQTATGGKGYALDLGAALQLNENYVVGAKMSNALGSMSWSDGTEEHGFIFNFDTMTVDNMDEDYVVTEDYTIEIDEFSSDLPTSLSVGIAKTSGSLLWAVDWDQGLEQAAGASTKPRLSVGFEWLAVKTLPLRVGYSLGGGKNTVFSFGSGFHLPVFYIDYALVTGTSFSGYSSKGLNFAITTGLYF